MSVLTALRQGTRLVAVWKDIGDDDQMRMYLESDPATDVYEIISELGEKYRLSVLSADPVVTLRQDTFAFTSEFLVVPEADTDPGDTGAGNGETDDQTA